MMQVSANRLVIDTNVVFEGLTRSGGASGVLIDAWRSERVTACVSNALVREYMDVFGRMLSAARWDRVQPALKELLSHAQFVTIHYTWRPMSADPGDDHVIDCAMNAGAAVVTWNIKDFRRATETLGLVVDTPVRTAARLTLNRE